MMIGWKECDDSLLVHFTYMEQTVDDCGRCSAIARLDQYFRRYDSGDLFGVVGLMRSRQYQQGPSLRHQPGNPALSLVQKCLITRDGAKLLGAIIAGDSSCQREQPCSIA